jgi:hypothetical protein
MDTSALQSVGSQCSYERTTYILALCDNVIKNLGVDLAVIPPLLHMDAKHLSGFYCGWRIAGVDL